jgi:hypothetical protein
MAQSANNNLTLKTAHDRLKIKITKIDRFFQQQAMIGCLDDNARKTEAGELQGKLWHRLGYLKILWNAEPSETKFEELTEWITGVNNEVKQIIIVMTVFMRARGTRLKTEHDDRGKSINDHPAGVAVALLEPESATNAQNGLNTDTAEMLVTLTPRAGDAEEQRFTLRPNDVSKMITIPTEQFNQRFNTPAHHQGGARVVMEQQERKLKMWPEGSLLAHLIDVRTTDTKVVEDNRQPARCWPPMGTHASYRMEGYRRLLPAPRIAQDRRCNEYGSVGHLARACTTKMTWVAEKKGNRNRREGKTPANRSGRPGGAGVHSSKGTSFPSQPRWLQKSDR